jgi:hypothetical protein
VTRPPTTAASAAASAPARTTAPSARQTLYHFGADFERGLGSFTDDGSRSTGPTSRYEIVGDPTGSGRGSLFRAIVSGPPPDQPGNFGADQVLLHRDYASVFMPLQAGAYAVQFDVWIGSDLQPKPKPDRSVWLSLASIFNVSPPGDRAHLQAIVDLVPVGTDRYQAVLIGYGYLGSSMVTLPAVAGAPDLTFDRWHTLRVTVERSGALALTQDGVPVSTGMLPADAIAHIGVIGAHWGLYGKGFDRATLLNDNITLDVFAQ